MSRHLVVGAAGLVGSHLWAFLSDAGVEVSACDVDSLPVGISLDIRDRQQVARVFSELRPDVVYLAAAITHVDYCESHPEETRSVNVRGAINVAEAASAIDAKVVYFSSDYVFDGTNGPYSETDPTNPICEYGRQKVLVEQYLALVSLDCLIIRTTVVYGWEWQRKNFVCRLLRTLQDGKALYAPADQIGSPTYAPDLAEGVFKLVRSGARGLYHVVGAQTASRYDFAVAAATAFGLPATLIRPVVTAELGQAARRPLSGGMKTAKLVDSVGYSPRAYPEGLRTMATNSNASLTGSLSSLNPS